MVKDRTNLFRASGLAALVLVALISSCGGNSNPVAPSADALSALPADGIITLKAPPPVPQSPIGNVLLPGVTTTLITGNAPPLYLQDAPFVYRFEVYKVQPGGGMVLALAVTANQTANSTSYTLSAELEQTGTFLWRVRVQIGDENGPWSEPATFRTPTLITVGPPAPLSPANGSDVRTSRPELIVTNGAVSANAGAVAIEFQIDDDPKLSNPSTFSVAMGTDGTTKGVFADPLGIGTAFGWRARATNGTITSAWSEIFTFNTVGGARAADPPPGQRLPLPNRRSVVEQVAAMHPDALANSCQEHGGSWAFMDLVVDTLRLEDERWGFNCKRGNCNDVSLDVIDYHNGADSSQGSPNVYVIDIILGHCGANPRPTWIDQTGTGNAAFTFPR
ncbi:MAG: hypothetical protein O3A25_01040 [Acidobacteria bacterium]|nr:hypothetical protein [Acidobacteriota bacterium]